MTIAIFSKAFAWCSRHPARAGSLAGLFQQGCTTGIAVLMIPIATSFLSPAEAGLWFSFQGLIAMISMIDLGFGFAISRQVAFTLGSTTTDNLTGDFIELQPGAVGIHQLVRLTARLYLILAIVAALFALLAYESFIRFGQLIPPNIPNIRLSWYTISASAVILVLGGGFASFLNGLGAVYHTRLLSGSYQLIAGCGAGFAAWKGGGLLWMSMSYAIASVFFCIALGLSMKLVIPNIVGKVPATKPGSLKWLSRAALPVGMVNIFGSLVYMIQPPLLGSLLGPEKVLPFYLAQKIGLAFNMLAMNTVLPQLPFYTRNIGQGNIQHALEIFRSTFRRGSAMVVICSVAYFMLSPWLALVILRKSSYTDGTTLALLALDFTILGLSSIGGQFVLASGRNPFLLSTILTGTTSLTFSVILTKHMGIAGLPLATLCAGLLFNYRKSIIETLKLNKVSVTDKVSF